MYVWSTVYGDAHLGHAGQELPLMLYLDTSTLGVQNVMYVTLQMSDILNDEDEGENKIAKKARLDQLEPMEVVAYYTRTYHRDSTSKYPTS